MTTDDKTFVEVIPGPNVGPQLQIQSPANFIPSSSIQGHYKVATPVNVFASSWVKNECGDDGNSTCTHHDYTSSNQSPGNAGFFWRDLGYDLEVQNMQTYQYSTYPGGAFGDIYANKKADVMPQRPDAGYANGSDVISKMGMSQFDYLFDFVTPDLTATDENFMISKPGRMTMFVDGVLIHDGHVLNSLAGYRSNNVHTAEAMSGATNRRFDFQDHGDHANQAALGDVWVRDISGYSNDADAEEVAYAKTEYATLTANQLERFGCMPELVESEGIWDGTCTDSVANAAKYSDQPYADYPTGVPTDSTEGQWWYKEGVGWTKYGSPWAGNAPKPGDGSYTQSDNSNRVFGTGFAVKPSDGLRIGADSTTTSTFKSFQLHATDATSVTIGGGYTVMADGSVVAAGVTHAPIKALSADDSKRFIDVVYHAPGAYAPIGGDAEVTVFIDGIAVQKYLRLAPISAEATVSVLSGTSAWIRPLSSYEKPDGLHPDQFAGNGFSMSSITEDNGVYTAHMTIPIGYKVAYEIGDRNGSCNLPGFSGLEGRAVYSIDCDFSTFSLDNEVAYDTDAVSTTTSKTLQIDTTDIDLTKQQRLYGILLDADNKPVSTLIYKEFGNLIDDYDEFNAIPEMSTQSRAAEDAKFGPPVDYFDLPHHVKLPSL
jgi:hypothetical protein